MFTIIDLPTWRTDEGMDGRKRFVFLAVHDKLPAEGFLVNESSSTRYHVGWDMDTVRYGGANTDIPRNPLEYSPGGRVDYCGSLFCCCCFDPRADELRDSFLTTLKRECAERGVERIYARKPRRLIEGVKFLEGDHMDLSPEFDLSKWLGELAEDRMRVVRRTEHLAYLRSRGLDW